MADVTPSSTPSSSPASASSASDGFVFTPGIWAGIAVAAFVVAFVVAAILVVAIVFCCVLRVMRDSENDTDGPNTATLPEQAATAECVRAASMRLDSLERRPLPPAF